VGFGGGGGVGENLCVIDFVAGVELELVVVL
jgi:hypothetical protein